MVGLGSASNFVEIIPFGRGMCDQLYTKVGHVDRKYKYGAFSGDKMQKQLKMYCIPIPIAKIFPSYKKSASPNPTRIVARSSEMAVSAHAQ